MLEVGEHAPDFEMNDQDGVPVRLHDLLEDRNVVLFFYPKDNTFVCTLEVCAFRDAHAEMVAQDAVVLGISADHEGSHKAIRERWRLPYRLLTDVGGAVNKSYEVGRTLGLFRGRVTYVIDRNGIIRGATDNPLRAGLHVKEALKALRAQGSP